MQAIRRAAQASHGQPVRLTVVPLASPTLERLRDALSFARGGTVFPIVHLGTAATVSGDRFLLEDDAGGAVWVGVGDLAAAFRGSGVRLVVLTACRGDRLARALVRHGVRTVIAFRGEVSDPEAACVAGALYASLAAGDTVKTALNKVRAELIRAYNAGRLPPPDGSPGPPGAGEGARRAATLIARGRLDASLRRVRPSSRRLPRRLRGPGRTSQWPQAGRVYVSRDQEEIVLTRWLRERRFSAVALCGVGGIGKSTLARTIADRCAANFDRVLYFSARDRFDAQTDILDHLWRAVSGELRHPLPSGDATPEYKRNRLAMVLNSRAYLLLLDNLEALTPDQTAELSELLQRIRRDSGTMALLTLRPEHFPPLLHALKSDIQVLRLGGLKPASALPWRASCRISC